MSKLTTVFFPKESKPFYRKAIVSVKEVEFFESKGAVRTVSALKIANPVKATKGKKSESR